MELETERVIYLQFTHKGFAFVDFFRLTKEQQDKYKEQVIAKLYS